MQTIVVVIVLGLSLAMLGRTAYRVFFPAAGKACGGDCCGSGGKEVKPEAAKGERVMMVRSDDLARRAGEIKRAAGSQR